VTIAVKWSNFFLCRNGKALCKRPFALHCQQPIKDKQTVDVAPPLKKFLQTTMEREIGAILTKVFRSLLHTILLNGAWASWGYQNVSQINYDSWKANKSGNDIYRKWICQNTRYDWINKKICIFESLEKSFP